MTERLDVGTESADEGPKSGGQKPKPNRKFGSLTPQEAGRKGAEAKRLRDAAQSAAVAAASDGRIVFVRVPIKLGDIVAKLAHQATQGDATSARELRSWLGEFPVDDSTDVSALDRRTREQLKARLLAELGTEGLSPEAQTHGEEGAA